MKQLIITRINEYLRPLSLLLTIPCLNLIYFLLNNSDRGAYSLVTDLDNFIPLLKIFVIPYLGWYLYVLVILIFLCVKDRRVYYNTIITINASLLIASLIYYSFQTTVPRPTLEDQDLLTQLVLWVYGHDQPYNCFPSTHVITTYIMMNGLAHSSAKTIFNQIIVYNFGILIILSTLFMKQHVILDVIGSILLVNIVFSIVENLSWGRKLVWDVRESW